MRHRLAIVLTVVGAIALPVVMAATVLYASDQAIGDQGEPFKPHFAKTAKGHTPPPGATSGQSDDRGGSTGGATTGGDDHGGSTGSSGPGSSGSSGSDDSGSNSGSGSSGSGSSGHGSGDD
jgi:hypothetical protein